MNDKVIDIEVVRKQLGKVDTKSADEIKTLLVTKCKVPFSKVNGIYKALGYTAQRKGYAAELYDILREGPMDSATFEEWLAGGSDNVRKHRKHYQAIVDLANDIHAAK